MARLECLPGELPDSCQCNVNTCRVNLAQRRIRMLRPQKAIIEAARENPSSHFVYFLSFKPLEDARYRQGRSAQIFIDHLLHGTPGTVQGARHWEFPAIGIMNIVAGIQRDESEEQEAAALREIHSVYDQVVAVLYKELPFMTQVDKESERRRFLAGQLIYAFLWDPHVLKLMCNNEKAIKVLLTCWLNSSPENTNRDQITRAIIHLFAFKWKDRPSLDSRMELASKAIKMATFTSQVNFNLKHKAMVCEPLLLELKAINEFVHFEEEIEMKIEPGIYRKPIYEARIQQQLLANVRRHLQKHQDDENTDSILVQSGDFIGGLIHQGVRTMDVFTDVVRTTPYLEIGAIAFRLGNRASSYDAGAERWYELLVRITHALECENNIDCPFYATDEFCDAVKGALELIAIPTFIALEEELPVGGDTRYLDQWSLLLMALGVTESSIRERYRSEKKCCNLKCPTRNSGLRSEKKSICVACQSVFYCNRACQKSDWPTHKPECRKLLEKVSR